MFAVATSKATVRGLGMYFALFLTVASLQAFVKKTLYEERSIEKGVYTVAERKQDEKSLTVN